MAGSIHVAVCRHAVSSLTAEARRYSNSVVQDSDYRETRRQSQADSTVEGANIPGNAGTVLARRIDGAAKEALGSSRWNTGLQSMHVRSWELQSRFHSGKSSAGQYLAAVESLVSRLEGERMA